MTDITFKSRDLEKWEEPYDTPNSAMKDKFDDLDDYDGSNLIEASELNNKEWLDWAIHCPGIFSITKSGHLYVLNFDLKLTYLFINFRSTSFIHIISPIHK